MTTQVGRSDSGFSVDPLQALLHLLVPSTREDEGKFSYGVEVCPPSLREAAERINTDFPEMFADLPSLLGRKIKIHLQVDVPVFQKNFLLKTTRVVQVQDIEGKGLSIKALGLTADKEGHLRVSDLKDRGVRIEMTNGFKASWNPIDCILTVPHPSSFEDDQKEEPSEWGVDDKIISLLFELENARATSVFRKIFDKANPLPKEEFIESLEAQEFETCTKTRQRLEQMREFDQTNNMCRFTYRDPTLFILHQHAIGHSDKYAKMHDDMFGIDKGVSYKGKWAVPFPPYTSSGVPHVEQLVVRKVLELHIASLYGPNHEEREAAEKKLRELLTSIHKDTNPVCVNILKNLARFQELYAEYVEREQPPIVVHLTPKCH